MAGWIALRYLSDPQTASTHFARIDEGATDPRILARAAYWRGRAAEAAGKSTEMRAEYEAAGRYPTAYYGQLARVRLGLGSIALRPPPQMVDAARGELLHAASILYAIGEHDLVLDFVSDLADVSSDTAVVAELGKLSAKYHDAQATLLVGKTALARGMAMEQYALRSKFPGQKVILIRPNSGPAVTTAIRSIAACQHFVSISVSYSTREVLPK